MFRLTTEHTYWWPVEIKFPAADPSRAGQFDAMTCKLRFRAISQDDARALDSELAKLPAAERSAREHEHIETVAIGWTDVVDEDGSQIQFSREAFRDAMQTTWFRMAVYAAYGQSLAGQEARLKN